MRYEVTSTITEGRLVVGERVEGASHGVNPKRPTDTFDSTWSGVYAGTYMDEGEVYFRFNDGDINGVAQPTHGVPTADFPDDVMEDGPWSEEKLQALAERIQREIVEDVHNDVQPADVPDYSALHDHTDANTYGGVCDDADPNHLIRVEDLAEVQERVDKWLTSGGLTAALREV